MAANLGSIIAQLLIESLPLGLFFLSLILTGNIMRHLYISNDLSDLCKGTIKLDLLSLTSGLFITLIPLFYKGSGILDVGVLKEQNTWTAILITSIITGVFIWNYRIYGKKWIKDQAQFIFGLLLASILFYAGYNSTIEGIKIIHYQNYLTNNIIFIKFIAGRIFNLTLATLVFIWGFKLFKLISKKKRYKKRKDTTSAAVQ